MTAAQILATTPATKTWKMQQLFQLGYTRTQVAEMLGVGYGFVQNVYTAWIATTATRALATPARPATVAALAPFAPGPLTRTFGVEIEAYGVTRDALVAELRAQGLEAASENYNHTTRNHWKIVSDSSVQGEHGFELVSPVLQGCEGLADLERACRALRICGARVNRTCGLHVHFGMRDATITHTRQVVRNYMALESTLDQLMPPSRRGNANTYCRSLLRGRTLAQAEREILAATTMDELSTAANGGSRYHKVNLQSFGRYGTLEFRQHGASTDFEKISFWVKFLNNLIAYSAERQVPAGLPAEQFTTFCQRDIATYYQRRRTALAQAPR
jgi:hypothetical protein